MFRNLLKEKAGFPKVNSLTKLICLPLHRQVIADGVNVCFWCPLNFAWTSPELFHWSVVMLVLVPKFRLLLARVWSQEFLPFRSVGL